MRKPYLCVAALLLTLCCWIPSFAGNLTGTWTGELTLSPQYSLRLVFNIQETGTVTMDSPDQGARDISCETVYLSADSLNVASSALRMDYSGKLINGKIKGTFRQAGLTLPLILSPGERKQAFRPQTPVAPFPYSQEEVIIEAPNARLAGTLTVPEGSDAETPVVVMVSGSGQQNRDEELFDHRPFAVMADWLARAGIASLRYDDRGVGDSSGELSKVTTEDFKEDAAAVLDWVRKQERFGKAGVLGHSEGGMIAVMLAADKTTAPDFIISIAGPSIKGSRTIAYQNYVAMTKAGLPKETATDFSNALEKAIEYRLSTKGKVEVSDALLKEIYPQYEDNVTTRGLGKNIQAMLETSNTEEENVWMMYFLGYDPVENLSKANANGCPAMLIYGELDQQVPAGLNADPAATNYPSATVKVYPGLNHLMQHAVTGAVEEYSQIEETISPEVLEDTVSFIKALSK